MGTVLAQRFTLTAHAGRGGMGFVYRATDSLSGQQVALKLLHVDSSEALQRFSREASILADLRHPGIVSYVAHGIAEDGRPFLAMEWLEGEDLAQRLSRQPLSLQEALALLRNTAQALAVAHQRGVIHRDLKPSNLFLRHGRPEEVVLLDFGLARHVLPSSALTATQMVLGTPGYMAPEQASSQSALSPSADIFSLGCVLYECLTGKPPFAAPHFVAALAKILFAEPAPLRSLRPELPSALEELLERMLAKVPERRFPEASSLLAALAQLDSRLAAKPSTAAPLSTPALHLAGAEQHLVSVLLAAPLSSTRDPLELQGSQRPLRDALRSLLFPHGAQVELLANGSLVATLMASHGSATDPAALAARCALFLQERWPQAVVVLATGRGRLDQQLPVGEAMDRAGQLLRQLSPQPQDSAARILLDEVTAGLLGSSFQLTRAQSGSFLLHGEQLGVDASRPLLGKPTPCVGREQELAFLEVALTTCIQEPAAQAVLVKAPAGVGKSRLRHEFLRRQERRSPRAVVLLSRGDPMSAGSADGLLGQALRRLCGISGGEPLEERKAQLARRLAQHLHPPEAADVIALLGELCGIPFSEEHSPRLRAARGNPRVMNTLVAWALVSFLQAECAHHPVLLVLEDLHWGDLLSIRLVDEALSMLSEQPFMVLALARPEIEQLLPGPWMQRFQEVSLRGLSRKAGARLVREVLGPAVPDTLIGRLMEQAAGNALFLEELIRGIAAGGGEAVPQTVLAMLQARLGQLEPKARQLLSAASFFGRTFWSSGIRELLGEQLTDTELERELRRLVELEWVMPQPGSRFPLEEEYRFRHALVRDAAYGLVPERHKSEGHRLAAQWLERLGESDPQILAHHFQLARHPERAIHFHTLAAEQLFVRHDMQGMARCMEAALALGPAGGPLVQLRALKATAAFWMDDFATLYEVGNAVLPSLKTGTPRWCHLISGLSLGSGQGARKEYLLTLYRLLLDTKPEPEARSAYALALCFMGAMAGYLGLVREADACFERLEHTGRDAIAQDSVVRGWRNTMYSFRSVCLTDGPWRALIWAEQSVQAFREVGAERDEVAALSWKAHALLALGDVGGAVECMRQSLALALRVGQLFGIAHARQNLMLVLAASPEQAHQQEARALARECVEAQSANRVHLGSAHLVLARVALMGGALAEAEAQARTAHEVLAPFAPFLSLAHWSLGALLLAQGRTAEAREVAEPALREVARMGPGGIAKVGLLQVLAEACIAEGDTAAGEQALRGALQCVRSRAEDIPDPAARERFLRQVPENARTLELARQRWGTAGMM